MCFRKLFMSANTRKKSSFRYDIPLPEDVNEILKRDFWMLRKITAPMLKAMVEPVKFSSTTSIYVRSGKCKAEINLMQIEIKAPCIVNIHTDNILRPYEVSDDFDAAFLVLSKRFKENVMMYITDPWVFNVINSQPVIAVAPEMADRFEKLFLHYERIIEDAENTNKYNSLLFSTLAFLFDSGIKCFRQFKRDMPYNPGRLSERFLKLVRQHFKEERFLDFYASQLEVTPKHLSRTVKSQTGYSAVEWIERLIILEARVLLKSSNLHVQQIADELNFPSQSVFGKYFKKVTGMSPREYRNYHNL